MSAAADANVGGPDWNDPAALRRTAHVTADAACALMDQGRTDAALDAAAYARELMARSEALEAERGPTC